jgi:hypothetical protein
MDKNKILQTLRDMQEIAERLENICEAQGISWGTSSMLSVGDLNLDHPEKTSIQLSWTMWGPYNSPPENESVYIPLSLLWDEEAIPRLLKARAEKWRQERIKELQKRISHAEEKISRAQSAREELDEALREMEAEMRALEESY